MKPTKEELAAFADGELDAARTAQIAAILEGDPELAREVAAHRALRDRLGAHFAPILDQPVPGRLSDAVASKKPEVVDFAAAHAKREQRRSLPRWTYFAAPAMAAALALALFLPRGGGGPGGAYASPELADTLNTQVVSQQAGGSPTRILISFQNHQGEFCRAFSDPSQSGIACRDPQGWRLADLREGSSTQATTYRQAGSDDAALMAKAQDMAAGPALDANQVLAARQHDWLPSAAPN